MGFKLSLASSKERIYDTVGKITLPGKMEMEYQVNPGQKLNCVLGINPNRMYTLEWGLIPSWSRTLNNRGNLTEINAEGAVNKTSSRIPFREKRGYVLCDGIYFIKQNGLEYTPYRFERKDGRLMKLACLWDEWKKDDKYLATTALMVQKQSDFIADSFPVELIGDDVQDWLFTEDVVAADQLINKSINIEAYHYYKVSDRLLDPACNAPDLVAPVPEELNLFNQI